MSRRDGNKKLNADNGKKFKTFYDDIQPAWVKRFLEGEAEAENALAGLYHKGKTWKQPPNGLKLRYSKVEKKQRRKPRKSKSNNKSNRNSNGNSNKNGRGRN